MPYVIIDAENNVTQRGYRVWTSVNINFSGISEENYTEVNSNTETKTPLFYINYWNGSNWIKRLINENNVVTVEDRDNREYKLINSELKLLNTSSETGEVDLSEYYKKIEVDKKINILNEEITYLKKIISQVLNISLTNKNGEKFDDEYISKMDNVIKEIEPGEGNEIQVVKAGSTLYIDINPNVLGEITNIE